MAEVIMIGGDVCCSSSFGSSKDESGWSMGRGRRVLYDPKEDPMLGFSSSLMERLKQSQKELTIFIEDQKKKVDDVQTSHESVVTSEQIAIDELVSQHQHMEAKRGMNNNNNNDDNGIVQQRQLLRQTQLQMEKEIATLRIQKDTKLHEVKGTFHFSISIILYYTILYLFIE